MVRPLFLASAMAMIVQSYTITDVDQLMMKNIDPIVLPGQYKSHMHSFFGSDAITKDLPTSEELRAGCATADNPNDFSVYWVPTLYYVEDDGTHTPISPKRFVAYYNFEKTQAETAIPEDFNVVAGNAAATSSSDLIKGSEVTWLCQGEDFDQGGKEDAQFPQSTCSDNILQAVLWFPDCVNPSTLESAYSSSDECSSGMKTMPQLRFSIRYDVSSIGSWTGDPPLALACGNSYCFHGDFINGWLNETLATMVTALTEERHVQALDGPNGKYRTKSICTSKATDADPDNGTSDYEESVQMMSGSSGTGTSAASKSAAKATSTSKAATSSSNAKTISATNAATINATSKSSTSKTSTSKTSATTATADSKAKASDTSASSKATSTLKSQSFQA